MAVIDAPESQPDAVHAATAVADPEHEQRASEANAALILLACLVLVVLTTQALVAVLGALA